MSKLSALHKGLANSNVDSLYKDDLWENAVVQAEYLETPGRDLDFD
jgi:hypothetical protein